MKPTHLDLFSGIGGFALAAKAAGFTTIGFCEIEPYAQQILKEKFGTVMADTKQFRCHSGSDKGKGRNISESSCPETEQCRPILHPDIFGLCGFDYAGVTLITGGFPCQPFSVAGQRRGKEDDRHLWPEMCRVIAEARPAWVLAENVPGIINMELDSVLSDLEGIGYSTGAVVIPACAVDARHRRDRVWIVAHGDETGRREQGRAEPVQEKQSAAEYGRPSLADDGINSSRGAAWSGRRKREQSETERIGWGGSWQTDGIWLPEPELGRVADGIPNRAHRLRALGNAIVPQVAEVILGMIYHIQFGSTEQ